ncbi:putative Transmembrane protein [Quillaja saponaria]|nr:putative Transmembrane protein [Quillaja saponaria]
MAGVWLLCGLGFGIFVAVKGLTGGSARFPLRDSLAQHYLLLFLLVLFLTSVAIIASSLVISANQSTLRRTGKLKEIVVGGGDVAVQKLGKVTKTLKQMQVLLLPYDKEISSRLNTTMDRLRKESHTIQHFVDQGGRSINQIIHSAYITHVVIITINLLMLMASLVLLILHWRPGLFIITFCCWVLTIVFWLSTGVDFFIYNFADDTCLIFQDFDENPQTNTLALMLPCMNETYSTQMMTEIGFSIHNYIIELNTKIAVITQLVGLNAQSEASGGVIQICDPFSQAPNHTYIPDSCPPKSILIGNLPSMLLRFTCQNKDSPKECSSNGKFIPEDSYNMVRAYSSSIQQLINIYPDLKSLSECKFVKDMVSELVWHQCKPLKVSIRLLWASMLSLSIVMMVLEIFWVAKAIQDWGRSFSACSITPN